MNRELKNRIATTQKGGTFTKVHTRQHIIVGSSKNKLTLRYKHNFKIHEWSQKVEKPLQKRKNGSSIHDTYTTRRKNGSSMHDTYTTRKRVHDKEKEENRYKITKDCL